MIDNEKDLLDATLKALADSGKVSSPNKRRGEFALVGFGAFGHFMERNATYDDQVMFLAQLREALIKRMAVDLLDSDLSDRVFIVLERFGRGYLSAALFNFRTKERGWDAFQAFSEKVTDALGI